MTVDNGGTLGDWSDTEYCPQGHFAIGYVMKIEKSQGGGDDSALNAIRLHCANPDWTDANNSVTIMGQEGPFGYWRDVAMCLYGEVMVSYSLQFEKLFNGDNSAANYVRFKCREIGSPSSGTTLGTSGLWGDFGAWSEYCAVGSAICGLKVRIQLPQGLIIDDTALNDVQFFCCKK
ncbi:vitelline membrane outer layer protein 1 homolog [Mytilus trossulus]|uniref:vitelline membrane outer layer protein 1 homolog n=1 Tax=Mytilus trossulus TaxID=6551 RepID=UPI003007D840